MAENIEMIRPINLPEAQQLSENDVFILDSETGGVRKIPKNKVYTPVDDTLSESGEAADAKVTGEKIDELKGETALIQNPVGNKSGELVSFSDGADMPAISVIAHIEPIQEGEGDPSPDNERPISGWESVNVNVTGKNMLPPYATSQTKNDITFAVNEDGTITANGTASATTVLYLSAYVDTWSSGTYILNGCPSTGGDGKYCLCMYKTGGVTYVSDVGNGVTFEGQNQLECAIVIWKNQVLSNLTFKPMIRVSGASAEYEPYTGTTTTTALGRTVYGGTLDVVSGVLTVTYGYVDLGTLSWTYSTSYDTPVFTTSRANLNAKPNSANCISSVYVAKDHFWAESGNDFCVASGLNWVNVSNSNYTDATSFKSAMSGVQLCYELATPQTYTLTPTEISTLLGENNVWADSGDVEITYRRDINIVIDELTNAIVSLGSNV